jgi:hypothetical protein
MLSIPIKSITGDGRGRFFLIYVDGTVEEKLREEMLFACGCNKYNVQYFSDAEATAFKYADVLPNELQVVS